MFRDLIPGGKLGHGSFLLCMIRGSRERRTAKRRPRRRAWRLTPRPGGVQRADVGILRDSSSSAPTGGKRPDFVIARAGTARGNPFPVFNVFKWQFENTAILHFALCILHFRPGGERRGAHSAPLQAGLLPAACCLLPVACCLLPARAACPLYFLFLAFTKAANCLTSSYISSVLSVSPPKRANLMSSSSTTVSVPGRGREALSLSMR